jgi:ATP-binding cassette subfamily D (ALD) protein 3
LITNSEEIAFYDGNKREKIVIDSSFRRLVEHLRKSMQFRFTMGIVDNMVAKCKFEYMIFLFYYFKKN